MENFFGFRRVIATFHWRYLVILMGGTWMGASSWGQDFTPEEYLQGYRHEADTSWFVFNEEIYGQSSATCVQLTGAFRDWSQDMNDRQWHLRSIGESNWILAVPNPTFATIPIRTEFKFRINEGAWMAPPSDAPNVIGGNLQFMHNMSFPSLSVELRNARSLWVRLEEVDSPLEPEAYRLLDSKGNDIPIAEILPNTSSESLLVPAVDVDIRRIYTLEIPSLNLKSWCSFDGWFRELYSDKELGANISEDGQETTFRIFSPRARQVRLYLYKDSVGGKAYQEVDMKADEHGIWEASFPANLKGVYYDFTVHGYQEYGNHFFETVPQHISDPYARVNVEAWGRSRVWSKTVAATPLKHGIPPLADVIAYEVHVQDFTARLPVPDSLQESLPAMHMPGLTNSAGESIGFDYLVDLGINVVHLMPVQEFLHYEDEPWKTSFQDDPFMREMGIAEENYQWGYRTSHAFAIENRFREKGTEHGAEREQFRDLVQAFHDKEIAVIIDIVPNHTAENMDDDPYYFHFSVLDKLYYYRTKDRKLIGEYGNEVKTENRPMVQRWLIDQCKHFIEEFGIDGFRIDLAGQIDRQTLQKLRIALGPDIILYGEPWIGSFDPEFEQNPHWDWYKHNSPITFFQDDARDAFKGSPFDLFDKDLHRGYAGGNYRLQENVKLALSAGFPEDKTPLSGINYLDIHDNWALADRFATSEWDGRKGVDEQRYKIAAVLLYTSLGPIVTHGGVELMRSKGLAPLEGITKLMRDGTKVVTKSRGDTYNLRIPNQFVWENVGKSAEEAACDYQGMLAFWKGLNKFRLSEEGRVFRQSEAVPADYYQWIDTVNPYQLAYLVDNQVLVLINVGSHDHGWEQVYLPEGKWKLIADRNQVDHIHGIEGVDSSVNRLDGRQGHDFHLPGASFMIWLKEK
ncbi:MAG: alpha-amylase family glycosyl hydrolase [Bacteroidota bacterium]